MEFASYITGFTDGEGSFRVSFNFRAKLASRIEVRPIFSISQPKKNLEILTKIRDYLKCGGIHFSRRDQRYSYEVRLVSDLMKKVIPHFKHYPLQTVKQYDFLLFEEMVRTIHQNHHLNAKNMRFLLDKAYQMKENGKHQKYAKEELLQLITR